jgi:hypothetical protein
MGCLNEARKHGAIIFMFLTWDPLMDGNLALAPHERVPDENTDTTEDGITNEGTSGRQNVRLSTYANIKSERSVLRP